MCFYSDFATSAAHLLQEARRRRRVRLQLRQLRLRLLLKLLQLRVQVREAVRRALPAKARAVATTVQPASNFFHVTD